MRRSLITACLLLATASSAFSENLDALQQGLTRMPASVLAQPVADQAYFVGIDAMNELQQSDAAARIFSRLVRGTELTPLESLAQTERKEWETKAGVTIDKLRYFVGFGRPPATVTIWGLSDAAAADNMIDALQERGFESAGAGVFGNGEPMKFDPQKRDPADPWRTMIGAAQFAAVKENTVVQANMPAYAISTAGTQPGASDNPIIKTALAGLHSSASDGRVVQAVVISPAFGITGIDPSLVLSPSADIAETRKKIEAQAAELGAGIPPYLGGIITDIQLETPAIGISLAYADCAIAQRAADMIAQRWTTMAGDNAQGKITAGTAQGIDGLCAATVKVVLAEPGIERNPAYAQILSSYFTRKAGILNIGTQ
jgi:hypothetical protein